MVKLFWINNMDAPKRAALKHKTGRKAPGKRARRGRSAQRQGLDY